MKQALHFSLQGKRALVAFLRLWLSKALAAFEPPCSSKSTNTTILYLSQNTFFVKGIDYTNHSLTLVDRDTTDNSACPRARHNLILEDVPLEYSKHDTHLTFYYNCTSSLPASIPVDCLTSGEKKSYFYVGHNEPKDLNWYGICEDKVVATELDVGWIRGLGAALSDGFVLDWRSASECAKCEASDGLCGFNNSTKDFLCFCKDSTIKFDHCTSKGRILPLKLSIALSAVGTAIAVTCCLICCFQFRKLCDLCVSLTKTADQNVEANLQQYGSLAPMAYSYSDIRKMTSSFKEKLGEGGYGGVYKGNVNGHPVAVKILKASEGNGEDFINEVASISQTSHVNVVTLLGFCLNRREKTIIYEFMPNGSFDKHIYREDFRLEWEVLYKIALGIARGLEYLHRGCNSRILHFDIKPHNILLDEDFCPKISDFGLAKLCIRKESIMSTLEARGTVGYIAPEVFCRNFGGVSHKSDVYSYGMMVLEMVGGKRNYNAERSHNSEIYFPCWAYHRIVLDEELNIRDRITNEEKQIAKKMILVGLWCIQTDPLQRPAIGKVIEMLEGSLEALQIPPKPQVFSPSRSEGSSLTTLELPAAKAFSNSPLSSTFEPTASEFV
ncbi:LEAF RUST 10 DISEASE-RESISTANCEUS RECEPTOR-LIKE PROTEIN KINASE-like 2.1 [Nicotiana tomentosiformis]|uniref:LEAF RUST 10 DISEASE-RESISTANCEUS RECEPTOR-LIKE PROTEIN KINASE-like 2.1 n=1 Tax=Nicotiana tomentosiformis TaxID=4098 RepID=UPI00388C71E0